MHLLEILIFTLILSSAAIATHRPQSLQGRLVRRQEEDESEHGRELNIHPGAAGLAPRIPQSVPRPVPKPNPKPKVRPLQRPKRPPPPPPPPATGDNQDSDED
jgi:hypothetical protein